MDEQKYRYTLNAVPRNTHGKGASRRLRRQGWVPAIVYGGDGEPQSIAVKQDEVIKNAKNESFFSQIINLKLDGQEASEVLVRDVQHHLYKPLFQHFDFQRIVRGQEISATVSLHFFDEESCPGVKNDGGIISHYRTSVEIICRPSKLPEYIAVDMGAAEMGTVVHMGNIVLPEGVRFSGEWTAEELAETAIAQVIHPQRQSSENEETEVSPDTSADADTSRQAEE